MAPLLPRPLALCLLALNAALLSQAQEPRHRVRTSTGQDLGSGPELRQATGGSSKRQATKAHAEAAEECLQYGDLYEGIRKDLDRWREKGINMSLMEATIRHHTTRSMAQKGIALGFKDGVAYVVDQPLLAGWVGHHPSLFFVYMKVETYVHL